MAALPTNHAAREGIDVWSVEAVCAVLLHGGEKAREGIRYAGWAEQTAGLAEVVLECYGVEPRAVGTNIEVHGWGIDA